MRCFGYAMQNHVPHTCTLLSLRTKVTRRTSFERWQVLSCKSIRTRHCPHHTFLKNSVTNLHKNQVLASLSQYATSLQPSKFQSEARPQLLQPSLTMCVRFCIPFLPAQYYAYFIPFGRYQRCNGGDGKR